jgi:peptidoglycan/xylan/chitin deacetylase (PgdA/CDA1 family)
MAREGHDVGLHGVDHRPLRGYSFKQSADYLRAARSELEDLADTPVRLYRPTFGAQSAQSFAAARSVGLDVVVWTTDVADWEPRGECEVVHDALQTPDGGILLFHDRLEGWEGRYGPGNQLDRVAVVDAIVQGWRDQGRVPSSVRELITEGRVQKSVWFRP